MLQPPRTENTDTGPPLARANDTYVASVSGNKRFHETIRSCIGTLFYCSTLRCPRDAIARFCTAPPSLIVVDSYLPPIGGQAFLRRLFRHPTINALPVVFVYEPGDLRSRGRELDVAHWEYLRKPMIAEELIRRAAEMVSREIGRNWDALPPLQKELLTQSVTVFRDCFGNAARGQPLPMQRIKDTCSRLVEVATSRHLDELLINVRRHDDYTYVHSMRAAIYMTLLGHALGLRDDDLLILACGGLFHDLGKTMIPREILNKPGLLSAEEYAIVKGHVEASGEMLSRTPNVHRGVTTIVMQHHEKLDGTGYPNGLKGSALNELARLAAIADVFSALTDARPYKAPMQPAEAIALMQSTPQHLDQHFLKLFRSVLLDTGRGAI